MKTVLVLRHAKSDWDAPYGEDHDRPLAPRGRKAAARIGKLLSRIGQIPDRVLASSATRARHTAQLAAQAGDWSCPIEIVPEFYGASPSNVIERVRRLPDGDASVLVVGHEPTWSALASDLMCGGVLRFPTAALARIDVDVDRWTQLDRDRGMLVWFVTPRLLKSAGLPGDRDQSNSSR